MKARRYAFGLAIAGTLIGLSLAGCATQARVETVVVKVPYAIPCATDPGPEPNPIWTAANKAARKGKSPLGWLLWAAFVQERQRNKELRAALKGCGG